MRILNYAYAWLNHAHRTHPLTQIQKVTFLEISSFKDIKTEIKQAYSNPKQLNNLKLD